MAAKKKAALTQKAQPKRNPSERQKKVQPEPMPAKAPEPSRQQQFGEAVGRIISLSNAPGNWSIEKVDDLVEAAAGEACRTRRITIQMKERAPAARG